MSNKLWAFIFFCLSGLIPSAFGDISWQMTDTSVENNTKKVIQQKIYITADKFAIENENGERFILNFAENILLYVNNKEKSCYTASIDKISQISKGIDDETMKIIDNALKDVPENQREEYKKMMIEKIKSKTDSLSSSNSYFPPQSEFKATGKMETMLGYETKEFVAKDKNGYTYDIWCAEKIKPTVLLDFYKKIELSGLSKKINMKNTLVPMGFPLKYTREKGTDKFTSVITSIDMKTVEDSVFKAPEGFKKKEMVF